MKKIIFVATFLISLMFMAGTVFAYDDKTTHPAITDEIVDFYNLRFDRKITAEEKEWLIQGAILEDTEPRYINHFYDPIYQQGWTGEYGTGWLSKDFTQKFSDVFLSSEKSVSALDWVHNQELQEKYKHYQGNRTWEKALYEYVKNKDTKEAFLNLGYVLHLLEDMSVPEHTRNDTHPKDSPYEDYTTRFTRGNFQIANDLQKQDHRPTKFNSLDEYFKQLANYSNNYFFSKDTINISKYDKPKIIEENKGWGYGMDKNNQEFTLAKVDVVRSKDSETQKSYSLNNDEVYKPILNAYWVRLSREAVLSGSGVIDLFFQEVAKAEKDPSLLKSSSESTSAVFSIYGGITKAVNSTISAAKIVKKTATEIPNKIANIWNKYATNQSATVIQSVPNTTAKLPSSSTNTQGKQVPDVSQVINKIKTLAMGIVDPNSASAENTDPSQPAGDNANNVISENTGVVSGGSGGTSSGGNSGSGDGGGEEAGEEVVLPAEEPALEVIPSPIVEPEPEIVPPVAEEPVPPTPISDIIPPIITIIGDNTVEITKDSVYTDAGATALDDIDGDITANIVTVNPVDTATLGIYTVTYDVSDAYNNVATQVTRTVNVVAPLPTPPIVPEVVPTPLNTFTIDKNTTLTAGEYNYDNLIITNNAVLTLEGDPTSSNSFKGVKINAVNITIDAGSSISADGKGYGPDQGPGAGDNSSPISNPGASYGGISYGNPNGKTYGSATKPIDLGSGGTSFTYGGGSIGITVSDTFINNGIVSANGNISSSGGSIYVTAKNIGGSGIFSANGGSLYAGNYWKSPGGGGRIAIYYQNSSFAGIAEAKGGCGQYDGMTKTCSQNGTVGLFDELSNDLYVNNSWRFQKNDSPFNFNDIFLVGSQVLVDDGAEITANSIVLDKASTLTLSGEEIINAGILSLLGNSNITVVPEKILSLKISNLNIENGSMISADAKGYVDGPGTPTIPGEAGASYGGKGGGASSKPSYGSDVAPVDFGSGTQSNRGGGAIRLVIDNNLQNNGIISANGNSERVSGGSIYVTANKTSGNGIFQANGGNTSWPNTFGGGGGRIAIYYKTSDFSRTATALVGVYCYSGCNPAGEAGTIKIIDDSIPLPPPLVLSAEKSITAFDFASLTPNVTGIIDETNHTISLAVPFGTDVKVLVPTIAISEKASVDPNTGVVQDFTNPVTYTVTAEDGSTQNYIVTVNIDPDPTPIPDVTPPSITSYTLNGVAGNLTTDPLTNPVSIVLTANEKVNWTSVKIEKEEDASIYKYFYPGASCDGSDTCVQNWDGVLSSGGLLQSGTYKIKVKMKDLAGNDFDSYLSPYIIIVNTSI